MSAVVPYNVVLNELGDLELGRELFISGESVVTFLLFDLYCDGEFASFPLLGLAVDFSIELLDDSLAVS